MEKIKRYTDFVIAQASARQWRRDTQQRVNAQNGQAMVEYLVVLLGILGFTVGWGMYTDGYGVWGQLVQVLRQFHGQFSDGLAIHL